MARPLRLEFEGALYHLTARGNARQDIFVDDSDRQRFLSLLEREVLQQGWQCYAYCLMSNHYHLLIETPEANLSKGMRRLNGSYTQAFNRRHGRVGHLLQGRYKSILVERDCYLLELGRYIVLNPVRAGMVNAVSDYPWSSYLATAGQAPSLPWLSHNSLLGHFSENIEDAQTCYRRFVCEGYDVVSPLDSVHSQIWLGGDDFLKQMEKRISSVSAANVPKTHLMPSKPDKDTVLALVSSHFAISATEIIHRTSPDAYQTAAYLLRRICNLSLGEVAAIFSVSPSRISHIQGALENKPLDKSLQALLTQLRAKE